MPCVQADEISNDLKDKKIYEYCRKIDENIGFKDESINLKNKKLITDHNIKIVVENFDERIENNS